MLFFFGLIVAIVGAIGLAFNFGYTPGIIAEFPADPRIYFGITTIIGLIALFMGITAKSY